MQHIISNAPVFLGASDLAHRDAGPIALVESAYALDGSLQDWLARVVAAAPVLTPRLGVVGIIQRCVDTTLETAHIAVGGSRAALDFLASLQARHLEAPVADYFSSPLARAGSFVAQGVAAGLPADFIRAACPDAGATDALGIYANLGDGWYVTILAPSDEVIAESRPRVTQWVRMSAHLGAGLRLRKRLLDPETLPEVVLTARGRVVHVDPQADPQADQPSAPDRGTMPASLAAARASDAVHRLNQARGPLRHTAPDRAISIWQGLMAGRWSLADRVEPDGRRLVVAYRNQPELPRPPVLTSREAAVARLASDGAALKEIGYTLGIAISTVHATLARAMRKLRVTTRAELTQLVRATQAPPAADIARVPLTPAEEPLADLSPALREVAGLILAGHPIREVARRRGTSERTVAHQLTAIYAALGVGSKTELAARVDLARGPRR